MDKILKTQFDSYDQLKKNGKRNVLKCNCKKGLFQKNQNVWLQFYAKKHWMKCVVYIFFKEKEKCMLNLRKNIKIIISIVTNLICIIISFYNFVIFY